MCDCNEDRVVKIKLKRKRADFAKSRCHFWVFFVVILNFFGSFETPYKSYYCLVLYEDFVCLLALPLVYDM